MRKESTSDRDRVLSLWVSAIAGPKSDLLSQAAIRFGQLPKGGQGQNKTLKERTRTRRSRSGFGIVTVSPWWGKKLYIVCIDY